MPLAELQELLTALYLSTPERQAWLAQPDRVGQLYGLEQTAQRVATNLAHEALEFYAASLRQKRFAEITKLLPRTSARHRHQLWHCFESYIDTTLPVGPKKHLADALAFGHYLRSWPGARRSSLLDVLQFELVPWQLAFTLHTQRYTYKASRHTTRLVQAHRALGVRCQTIRFQQFPSVFLRASHEQSAGTSWFTQLASLGMFLKVPGLSAHFEWYVPWPRRRLATNGHRISQSTQTTAEDTGAIPGSGPHQAGCESPLTRPGGRVYLDVENKPYRSGSRLDDRLV